VKRYCSCKGDKKCTGSRGNFSLPAGAGCQPRSAAESGPVQNPGNGQEWEWKSIRALPSFSAEIITEEFTAVFVLVAIKAEIFPVGAIRRIIPGIAILVMYG